MDFTNHLHQVITSQLPAMIASYGGDLSATSLSEMETEVRQLSQSLGRAILQQWLEAQTPKYADDMVVCPHCGGQAQFVRRRSATSITLSGRITYCRPYHLCLTCHHGHAPLDEQLAIQPGQMSHEVQQMAALVGIHTSFATSQDLLARIAHLELSANSIRKACQQVGAVVTDQEAAWQQTSQDLEEQRTHQRELDKPAHIYGSLDGFMVYLDGSWHEMKAGSWWTTTPTRDGEFEAKQITYYTDWLPAAEFSDLTWATGFHRLADQAEVLIFVADGAEWIWRIVKRHFPQAVQIVDWYHALTYLRAVAQAAFSDEQTREVWFEEQRRYLWQGQRSKVFGNCRPLAAVAPDAVSKLLTYFTHNRQRLRYDRFRAAGYQIGSGVMESGCKQLGVGRLKIAGAQWSSEGARLIAKARAAYLSGQWDAINLRQAELAKLA